MPLKLKQTVSTRNFANNAILNLAKKVKAATGANDRIFFFLTSKTLVILDASALQGFNCFITISVKLQFNQSLAPFNREAAAASNVMRLQNQLHLQSHR